MAFKVKNFEKIIKLNVDFLKNYYALFKFNALGFRFVGAALLLKEILTYPVLLLLLFLHMPLLASQLPMAVGLPISSLLSAAAATATAACLTIEKA